MYYTHVIMYRIQCIYVCIYLYIYINYIFYMYIYIYLYICYHELHIHECLLLEYHNSLFSSHQRVIETALLLENFWAPMGLLELIFVRAKRPLFTAGNGHLIMVVKSKGSVPKMLEHNSGLGITYTNLPR